MREPGVAPSTGISASSNTAVVEQRTADDAVTGETWSQEEVRKTVRDYLAMLVAETEGTVYNKANHRRALILRLRRGRTEAAIEFKHQNISAVMVDLGLPYIKGYRPRGNYQRSLVDEVRTQLGNRAETRNVLVTGRPVRSSVGASLVAPPPTRRQPYEAARHQPPIDYVALQVENIRLGRIGEELVVELEKRRLADLGLPDLAERVRWVASVDGDGAGYDVRSYDLGGTELYIEVKTTALGASTPFYLSSAELAFAREHVQSYRLYRVYDLEDGPKVFVIDEPLLDVLELAPITFRAQLAVAAS